MAARVFRLVPVAFAFALAGLATAACAIAAPKPDVAGVPLWPFAGTIGHTAATYETAPAAETTRDALEAALFARVNADRADHGLPPVAADTATQQTARVRAAAQAGPPRQALSHDDALGPLAFRRLLVEAGVPFSLAGENLARPRIAPGADAAQLAVEAERALMASATHRENILESRFNRLAVGAAQGADGQVVFAQIFRG
jgi:uncharacterized protein YkwD